MENLISSVVSFILGVGVVWGFVKKFYNPAKEIVGLLQAVLDAIEDKKLTPEEMKNIIKEAKDINNAIKNLDEDK